MRIAFIVLLTCAMSAGCSHAYYIRSVDSAEFRNFDSRAAEGTCSLVLFDGSEYEARDVKLAEDTTSWVVVETGERVQAPTRRILKIVFTKRGEGAMGGAVLGFVAGGIIGAGMGWSEGDEDCRDSSEICLTREQLLTVGFFLVGLPGALLGGIIGAGYGTTYVFYPFHDESTASPGDLERWDPW